MTIQRQGNPGGMLKETKRNYKKWIEIYERAKIFGLAELRAPENAGIKPFTPLPYCRTAYELGHCQSQWSKILKTQPMKEFKEKTQAELMDRMQKNSDSILDKTFDLDDGGLDMKDSERARLALDFKKSTDKRFNPTQSIDLSIAELDFSDLANLKEQLSEELNLSTNEDSEDEDTGNKESGEV